ncbi:MFS transporter [Actinoplanes philippinensis]|uniref:Major Facilitator Superfamily protein n=1 Tax=Actinoplanes philippinensis TaxID=35752 RepID=A0A1I2NDN9_9ACTN|nr:MFS transporter [Actinoplanes philippinensis]GIE82697.1 MFS transporter [Actinoplanes philippinensis]SFG01703.1 Major Facilitator Superfamily protein [Actinoplanes philippinensis]
MHALQDSVLLYPVYALLFADAGLTTAETSSLFAIWSVVSFVCEIPAGALADTWSRKRLYALGEVIAAAGWAVWLIQPSYPGFAAGFVLWGLGGAFASGSLEALVYDHLGDGTAYTRIMGRARMAGMLGILAATLLAGPALRSGGYLLVGVISVATVTAGGLLALALPEKPRGGTDDGEARNAQEDGGYLGILRTGLRTVTGGARVLRVLAVAMVVPGFSALDEYLPLLAREMGAPTPDVPLWFALTALAMAAGSGLADRLAPDSPRPLAGALTLAAALLAAGSLTPHPAGLIPVSAAFGLLQFAMVHAETRLQDAITGPARATALSVAGFGAEVAAVLLYAAFGLPVALPLLCAVMAVPLSLTALLSLQR